MKKTHSLVIGLCLLAIPFSSISGQAPDTVTQKKQYGPLDLWGIGIKASTDGFGFELVKGFGQRLNIRLGYSMLDIPISYPLPAIMEGFSGTLDAHLKFGGVNFSSVEECIFSDEVSKVQIVNPPSGVDITIDRGAGRTFTGFLNVSPISD